MKNNVQKNSLIFLQVKKEGLLYKNRLKGAGIEINEAALKLGMTRQNLGYHLRKDKIDSDFKEKLVKAYPDIFTNAKLDDDSNASIISNDPQTIELPLITIASSRDSFNYDNFSHSTFQETSSVYKIRVKGLTNPVLIDIDGYSMSPQLNPNTRVLADEVSSSDWQYVTGVVAVSFKKQFVVKRIKDNQSILTKSITLHSDNPNGGSFSVLIKDINAIWKIIEIVKAKVE